jgi:hypothetical protein
MLFGIVQASKLQSLVKKRVVESSEAFFQSFIEAGCVVEEHEESLDSHDCVHSLLVQGGYVRSSAETIGKVNGFDHICWNGYSASTQ